MVLTDIYDIKNEFKKKIGVYLKEEIVPLFMESWELGKKFNKENPFVMKDGSECWGKITNDESKDFYINTTTEKFKIRYNAEIGIIDIKYKNLTKNIIIFIWYEYDDICNFIWLGNFGIFETLLFYAENCKLELEKMYEE